MQKKKTSTPTPVIKPAITSANGKQINYKGIYFFIAFLTFLLYANTLGHNYTVDDSTVIENNKFTVKGFGGLKEIFTTSYRAGFWERKEGLYRPISVAMFAIEWGIAPKQPFLGHLINILIYALSAVILLSVLRRLLQKMHPLIPIFITLLWVFHPVHTEVVANIKSRDELLSFLFGISALSGLFRYVDTHKLKYILLAGLAFFLALLSKENSVAWAGVFSLAIWCFTKVDFKKTMILSSVFIGVIGIYFLVRISVLGEIGGGYELMLINNSLIGAKDKISQMAGAFYIMGRYFGLFLLPATLVFDYSYNTIPAVSFAHPLAFLSFGLIVVGLLYAFKYLPKRSMISFSILFFLGTILLVSNVFFLIEATMAERFIYTPSLGLCLLAGYFANKWLIGNKTFEGPVTVSHIRNNKLFIPGLLLLILFGGRTIVRSNDWKDNLTLLQKDVKSSPESARIRYALGSTLLVEKALEEPEGSAARKNYLERSILELQKGVSILPNYNDAWYHLGIAYKELGDAKNAVLAFEQARSYKPFNDANHFTSSGIAYGLNKQYDKAIADLEAAVKLDPQNSDAWNNYGLYLSEGGNMQASLDALNKSIALKNDFDKAYYNRGNTYAKAGNYREALKDYATALSIKSNYTDALNNSGNCYIMLQRPDSAVSYFERAIQSDPGNVKAVINLGVTLQNLGDTVNAKIYFEKARSMGAAL
ncbi:MAG: tetratricopeptide repeat protein [Bacteroidetes bacterium]|nr:tetratricopeptide repeat protein [Bacteroidota bacterium]